MALSIIQTISSVSIDVYLALFFLSVAIGIGRYLVCLNSEWYDDVLTAKKQGWIWGLNCAKFSIPAAIIIAILLVQQLGMK